MRPPWTCWLPFRVVVRGVLRSAMSRSTVTVMTFLSTWLFEYSLMVPFNGLAGFELLMGTES